VHFAFSSVVLYLDFGPFSFFSYSFVRCFSFIYLFTLVYLEGLIYVEFDIGYNPSPYGL